MAYVALLVYVLILFTRPQEWQVPSLAFLRGVPVLDFVVGGALVAWISGTSNPGHGYSAFPGGCKAVAEADWLSNALGRRLR